MRGKSPAIFSFLERGGGGLLFLLLSLSFSSLVPASSLADIVPTCYGFSIPDGISHAAYGADGWFGVASSSSNVSLSSAY